MNSSTNNIRPRRPRWSRVLAAAGATAAVALAAAACGSSSSSNSSAASSSGSNSSAAASGGSATKGAPIKLLVDYPAANAIQNFPSVATAAQAAAAAINKAGGIDGHSIQMLTCNNEDDANDSLKCARDAVENHVVSVVGQADLYSNESLPLFQSANIPSVGLFSVDNPQDQTSPMSFLLNAGSVGSFLGAPFLLAQHHIKTVAEAVATAPVAVAQAKLIVPLLKQAGITFKGVVSVPLTGVTNFAPYAAQLKDTGAQAVVTVIPTPDIDGVVSATSSIGYSPLFTLDSQVFGETDVAAAPSVASHLVISSPYASPRDLSNPLIAQYAKDSAAFAGQSVSAWLAATKFDSGWSNAVDSWLSVYAVAKAFAAAPSGSDLSSATLLKVLTDKSTSINLFGQPWMPAYNSTGATYYPRINSLPLYYLNFVGGKLNTVSQTPINIRTKIG
jgi:ABC-type branched-subunit amino acid transport system substrate-binding protein